MNKRIFLSLLCLFSATSAMNLKSPEELIEFLTSSQITPIEWYARIHRFEIFNQAQNTYYTGGFFNHAPANKPLSLTFLQENINENNFSSVGADYKLLCASLYGNINMFTSLEKEAKIGKPHTGFYPSIFNLQDPNKKLLSYKDLENGEGQPPFYLVKSPHDYGGRSKYNWNVWDFALHRYNLNIIQEIIRLNPEFLTDSDKKEGEMFLQQLEKEQSIIQKVQENNTIPTFTIDPYNSISSSSTFGIGSIYDPAQQLDAFITPDSIKIRATTDPSTWKYTYPDIDTLRKLYTHIISNNKIEGKKLAKKFSSFAAYPSFYNHFLSYFIDFLECQFHRHDPIIPENLMILSQQIVTKATLPRKFTPKEKLFFETLLRFIITQKKEHDQNSGGNTSYTDIVNLLVQKPLSKALLVELCSTEPQLLAPFLKSFIQNNLLRNFLVRSLCNSTPLLSQDIATHIAEYWTPDEKYKNYFRPPVITEDLEKLLKLDAHHAVEKIVC
jgi:hypothetical protein